MSAIQPRNYPVKVHTSFTNDRKALIYAILKHSCVKRRVTGTGETILQFRDSVRDHNEETLRNELERLSKSTLTVVMAAFMRNSDSLTHGFIVRIVRCYVEARPQSKRAAEAVLYYAARLSNVLIGFTVQKHDQYERCISIAADVVSSAHLFRSVDDKLFRSGSFFAERSMKGLTAWFCMGKEKILDTDTLYFLSKNLELLAPHADEIRKQTIYDVGVLQEILDKAAEVRELESMLETPCP